MAQRYALLIGCNEYAHYRRLNFCVQDVDLLKETLTEWCDYDEANVVVEKPSASDPVAPAHVLQAIRALVEKTEDGDTILFYFAGHGQGKDGKAYLALPTSVPSDIENTGAPLEAVSDVLRQSHRLCVRIFDACHSGMDARSDEGTPLHYPTFARAVEAERTPELNWVSLASCRHQEESYEDPDLGQGFFTYALSNAIRKIGENKDVEALPLFNDVYREVVRTVEERGRSQHPVTTSSLSGLGVFACRIVRPEPPPVVSQPKTHDLLSRLAQARSIESQLVRNRKDELTAIASTAGELLKSQLPSIETFGVAPKVQVGSTSLIPKEWHGAIVRYFEKLGVRSLHSIHSTTSRNTPFGILSLNQTPVMDYYVPGSGPGDSVALFKWAADQFVPEGQVVCYVIPLETQVHTLVWLSVDSFVGSEDGIVSTLQRYGFLEAGWQEILAPAIRQAVEICATRLSNSVTAYCDYLDRERSKA